jgi:UDP-N-acetylglucosamine--N-acetylmuramyl-(pentapeptide) pyrophosphoryl-undecaprenol N-acetylglucosamine transferase
LKNIVITGGGTGGHLSIAKAIKEEFNKRGIKPIFIGSSSGQDAQWFKDDDGFEACYFLDTASVVDKKYFGKLISLFRIFIKTLKCRNLFKLHSVDRVFSVGGYGAAPASFAAVLFGKKFFIHEQNAVFGKLHKILSKKAKSVFSSYLESSPVKNYPIREEFFKDARLRQEIKIIIFLGGSQGASAINDFAMSASVILKQKGIKIIHQCGKKDEKKIREFYEKNQIKADLFPFSLNLHTKIKDADFAICRAGAGTLWELCAAKVPALYIPYPYAAGDHQFFNANFLAKRELSFVKRERDLKIDDLEMVFSCDIKMMSEGLGKLIEPNGVKNIVDYLI